MIHRNFKRLKEELKLMRSAGQPQERWVLWSNKAQKEIFLELPQGSSEAEAKRKFKEYEETIEQAPYLHVFPASTAGEGEGEWDEFIFEDGGTVHLVSLAVPVTENEFWEKELKSSYTALEKRFMSSFPRHEGIARKLIWGLKPEIWKRSENDFHRSCGRCCRQRKQREELWRNNGEDIGRCEKDWPERWEVSLDLRERYDAWDAKRRGLTT
ncbi:hypothetical protein B0J14DRAFT_558163 [Halenospora varia]|nr:hypothetical protein B0J14DRAFT_558163 [Halenospora varia]